MKIIVCILLTTIYYLSSTVNALAIYDPLSVPNNRVGVHVLSPDELIEAVKLVNNDNQAAWGYVTVPIQTTDRNREKWTAFMIKCTEQKIIPIIRVATTGDGPHWLKPQDNDLIDFANFLNDLPWPIKNRYVVLFNEVNRADEYGGSVSPENYADILNNAVDIFKRRSDKFFIIPSALDNAAPNGGNFMRWDIYLDRMFKHLPEVFEKIDGWNSHAYGNPGFSASPALSGFNKPDSFKFDLETLNKYTKRKLPVFITEAGWSRANLDDRTIATFYNHAFYNVWSHDQVVAVTPFLLFAGAPPFSNFSLLNSSHLPTLAFQTIASFATQGSPQVEIPETPTPQPTSIVEFTIEIVSTPSSSSVLGETAEKPKTLWQKIASFIGSLFRSDKSKKTVTINGKSYQTEIVSKAEDLITGLAKYDKLESNQAMLFDMKQKQVQTFWMKDMKFDIDIVWISDDTVVGVSPGYYKKPFDLIKSPSNVNYVLEVNPNSGITPGNKISIK